MTDTVPIAEPQFSDDRQWWWNGAQWVPASESPSSTSVPETPSSSPIQDPTTFSGVEEATYPYPLDQVYRTSIRAVSAAKGIKIKKEDAAAHRLEVATGISATSWGDRVVIGFIPLSTALTRVSTAFVPKGTIHAGFTTVGQQAKTVSQIFGAISAEFEQTRIYKSQSDYAKDAPTWSTRGWEMVGQLVDSRSKRLTVQWAVRRPDGEPAALGSHDVAGKRREEATGYPMHTIGDKERAQLLQTLTPGEKVLSQCVGVKGQTLVVTDRKVLIIKTGWMAGSALGAKVTAFDYRTITSVEIRTGPVMGALSISSGGVRQVDRTYWDVNSPNGAFKSPDAIPIAKIQAPDFQKAAALIRELAASGSARSASPQLTASSPNPIEQLKGLGDLRAAGVITPEEFETKKAELLARM